MGVGWGTNWSISSQFSPTHTSNQTCPYFVFPQVFLQYLVWGFSCNTRCHRFSSIPGWRRGRQCQGRQIFLQWGNAMAWPGSTKVISFQGWANYAMKYNLKLRRYTPINANASFFLAHISWHSSCPEVDKDVRYGQSNHCQTWSMTRSLQNQVFIKFSENYDKKCSKFKKMAKLV